MITKPYSVSQLLLLVLIFNIWGSFPVQAEPVVLARLKYQGGGDWYNDPSILPNLAQEISQRTPIDISPYEKVVEVTDDSFFHYPFVFATGHGKIVFNSLEAEILRRYLLAGGFLYVDDDFGMDKFFRPEIAKVFPEFELTPLPYDFPLFQQPYSFIQGVPKIHEHAGGAPQTYGVFDENGRLMVLYTYNTNISDGWASPNIHKDSPQVREQAFQMGINIVEYALTH